MGCSHPRGSLHVPKRSPPRPAAARFLSQPPAAARCHSLLTTANRCRLPWLRGFCFCTTGPPAELSLFVRQPLSLMGTCEPVSIPLNAILHPFHTKWLVEREHTGSERMFRRKEARHEVLVSSSDRILLSLSLHARSSMTDAHHWAPPRLAPRSPPRPPLSPRSPPRSPPRLAPRSPPRSPRSPPRP